ncbi:MAG: DEAD/DEAH box helicase [Rhodothermales bacterium]|nr:DEAD/DEAH box helicase [Rhodothermales bacterium]
MTGQTAGATDAFVTEAAQLLDKHWGYSSFRPGQFDVIQDVCEGRDALAVMPTGAGKSLCYALPALITEGTTLVVSPLLALMADQLDVLRKRGLKVEQLAGSMSHRQREHAWSRLEHSNVHVLFVSPETLGGEVFQARAQRLNISRVAVDEAHCISEWGHDFRPAYRSIRQALDAGFGQAPPMLAVTATAPPRVRKDISAQLGLREPRTHVWPIDRPNITWTVRPGSIFWAEHGISSRPMRGRPSCTPGHAPTRSPGPGACGTTGSAHGPIMRVCSGMCVLRRRKSGCVAGSA